jgi:hypothetical protein
MVNNSQADICFGASIGSMVFYTLSPVNNASAKVIRETQPSYELCKSDLTTFTKGNIPEIEISSHICILTNQKHLAVLNIIGVQRVSATSAKIHIEFKTWKADFP